MVTGSTLARISYAQPTAAAFILVMGHTLRGYRSVANAAYPKPLSVPTTVGYEKSGPESMLWSRPG